MHKQAENISNLINNSSLVVAIKILDSVMSELSLEHCERAKALLKRFK